MTIKELSNLGYETYEIAKTSAEAIQTFMQKDSKFSSFVESKAKDTKKGKGAMLDIKTMLELAADYINKNGMYEEYLKSTKVKVSASKPKPVVKKEPVKKKDIFDLEF